MPKLILQRAAWAVFACLALWAVQWLPAAEAHAEPLSVYPAPGARLDSTPAEIRLTFSERIGPGSRIQLFHPLFRPVAAVRSGLDPAAPELLRAFPPALAPDIYTVEWNAVSLDGHPVSGSDAFEVTPAPRSPAWLWAAGLLVLAVVVLGGVWALARQRRGTRERVWCDAPGGPGLMHARFVRHSRLWGRLAGLALALCLSACSIDISGATPAATRAAPVTSTLVAPTAALTATQGLATNQPGPTATHPTGSTAAPAATASSQPAQPQPTPFSVPVTWADQHLAGKLVFTAGTQGVLQFDLATGVVTSVFAPPDPVNSWVVAAAVSEKAPQAVIAYAPPPVGGALQFGYTALYRLPQPGGAPQPIFTQPLTKESYFDPTWSPDGQWL